jgi:uncharacterized membrane protein
MANQDVQDVIAASESTVELPMVRVIGLADLKDALVKGLDDFWAMPTHVAFLSLMYPVVGIVLGSVTLGHDLIPDLYPLAAGFALIGSFATIGLSELSRRRELGLDTSWKHAFDVIYSKSLSAIVGLGLLLSVIFVVWVAIARGIYVTNFGYKEIASLTTFASDILTTPQGHNIIVLGNSVGFLFAVLVFSLSVVSFPLLLDRDVGAAAAALTSVRVVLKNPMTMVLWALIIACSLVIGSLAFFFGLALVIPVLGHSTWHLYRKAVERDLSPRREYRRRPQIWRHAADFPAALFSWQPKEQAVGGENLSARSSKRMAPVSELREFEEPRGSAIANQDGQDLGAACDPAVELPMVRSIGLADLKDALVKGLNDFWAMPTHVAFLSLMYPVVGVVLGSATLGHDFVPDLYPLAAGFALIGPFAAIGLSELSRRRELGLDTSWKHAFDVVHSKSLGSIVVLGLLLSVIFVVWVALARAIYVANFGYEEVTSLTEFATQVLTTPQGHNIIVLGNAVGFLFAVLVFSLSVVSFPLLLDRNVGVVAAALTSMRTVLRNPVAMAIWGLIVAGSLVVGSLAFFFGLALVMPVLGHSTWHLYRKVVALDLSPRLEYQRRPQIRGYAADFPAVLFSSQPKAQSGYLEEELAAPLAAGPLSDATTEVLSPAAE